MGNIDSDSGLMHQLQAKMDYYENQINSGIFFKLESGKEPSEIFGVLDFLKYKFKKWKRTSIFSYNGDLFSGVNILIVGTESMEEARTILHFVYFKELMESEEQNLQLKIDSIEPLDLYLEKEFIKNLKVGYPANEELEQAIQAHLISLINDKA